MKKLVLGLVGLAVLIVGAGIVILQLFPGTALSSLQAFDAWRRGYISQSVVLDGYTANFYEAGPEDAPVVVLLHGLIDNRNSFVPAAAPLSGSFRVILPDLQGHGDNEQVPGRDYSIRGQVEFIADLLDALEVGDLIVGGNSMGGHVAAAFALTHEDRVDRLLVLNATGMVLDAPPTYSAYPDGIDRAYMEVLYADVFITPPSIPGPIMGHLAADLKAKAPFYNTLIEEVVGGEDFRLDERLTKLDTPTLIIWGTEDHLVPTHYARAYHAALPEAEFLLLEAGHAPQLEVPGEVSAAISAFIGAE